jgi:hypothetical protein
MTPDTDGLYGLSTLIADRAAKQYAKRVDRLCNEAYRLLEQAGDTYSFKVPSKLVDSKGEVVSAVHALHAAFDAVKVSQLPTVRQNAINAAAEQIVKQFQKEDDV